MYGGGCRSVIETSGDRYSATAVLKSLNHTPDRLIGWIQGCDQKMRFTAGVVYVDPFTQPIHDAHRGALGQEVILQQSDLRRCRARFASYLDSKAAFVVF